MLRINLEIHPVFDTYVVVVLIVHLEGSLVKDLEQVEGVQGVATLCCHATGEAKVF